MLKRKYKNEWKENESVTKIKVSAFKLAKLIVGAKNVLERHQKELLDILIWKITEANGKHNTRFVSRGVYHGGSPVEHEHVVPKKELITLILKKPTEIKKILDSALGCLVTRDEHRKLTQKGIGKSWMRYRSVKIQVYDRLKKRWSER